MELLVELQKALEEIDKQIETIHLSASKDHFAVPVYAIRDMQGNYLLSPLLVAKANLLVAITELRRASRSFSYYNLPKS